MLENENTIITVHKSLKEKRMYCSIMDKGLKEERRYYGWSTCQQSTYFSVISIEVVQNLRVSQQRGEKGFITGNVNLRVLLKLQTLVNESSKAENIRT